MAKLFRILASLLPPALLALPMLSCDIAGEGSMVKEVLKDKSRPYFTVSTPGAKEGSPLVFTVVLSKAVEFTVVLEYKTTDGTATLANNDYVAKNGGITFLPGEVSKTISVSTIIDSNAELDETVLIDFTGGENYHAGASPRQVAGTILREVPDPTITIFNSSIVEGGDLSFSVVLSGVSEKPVFVNYATANGTATLADNDYTAASGSLAFAPGETLKTITVHTTLDLNVETDETIQVTLSGGSSYTVAGSTLTAVGGILMHLEDQPPAITISSTAGNEGTILTFVVSLSHSYALTTTVNWATSDSSATVADSDYSAAASTLTFLPGQTAKTINVATTGDMHHEINESFIMDLSGGSGYTLTGSTMSAAGTITNEDAVPTLSIGNASATESGDITFTATLSRRSYQTVTVNFATSDGTGTLADLDYSSNSGTLTFNPGELSKTITVNTTADAHYEANETLSVTLSGGGNYNPTGSTLGATGTINDDDPIPTISIANDTQNEGTTLTFTATLSERSYQTITVDFATSDGTGTTADSDYSNTTGTLTFNPGVLTQNALVNSTGDTKFENSEDMNITLSGGANYTVAGSTLSAVGTITNDDSMPTVTVGNANAAEGSAVVFSVTLSNPSFQTVTVDFATSDGTGTLADSDYTNSTGTITFSPGEVAKTASVNTTGDTTFEADETFGLALSGGANYTVGGSTLSATGTINNNDFAPTLSIGNEATNEGGSLVFTATLSNSSAQTITVDFATSDNTATTADSDYTSNSGTLTFNPGDLTKTITVNSTADAHFEANEIFDLTLSGGSNYTVAGSTLSATGTITNEDGAPTISVANTSSAEGSDVVYTVSLAVRSFQTITVDFATSDGTATTADSDYSATSGTLTFNPGDLSKTITVTTTADFHFEANETTNVTLSGGSNYTAAGSTLAAVGTINNDDSAPTLSIANSSATEGGAITFTVTLAERSFQTITVDYATSDGTGTTGDADYTNTSGTITFNPGDLSKNFTVNTITDSHFEANETLNITLSGGANYTAAGSTLSAVGTINDDDTAPTLSIANASATEGSAITFTVTLAQRSFQTITVDYATSDGTATTADSDYTSASATVTLNPGDLTKTFNISTTADTQYENNETLNITLSGGANYTAAGSTLSATGTINNDDGVPTISIANATGDEGGNVVLTVTQSSTSAFITTFDYATSNGTATSGADFTGASASGSIAAGATTTTISVAATDDALDEADETFTVTISNPANATITTAAGTGTIADTAALLDFMAGSLPAGTTYSRASAGTYIDSTGVVASAASGVARFDHDPLNCPGSVCVARGLLLEPASTNLAIDSEDFSAWTKTSLRTITSNVADAASPDGVNSNAELVRENNVTGDHAISQAIGTAVTAGSVVQFTVFAKPSTASPRNFLALTVGDATTTNFIRANFDLTGGNSPTSSSGGNGGGQISASAQDVGNGWWRVRVGGVASTTATALTVTINMQDSFAGSLSYNGDNASGVNLWGAQLEAGLKMATSYIVTTVATATRPADLLSLTAFTGFSGNFGDGTNWTMIADISRPLYEPTASAARPIAAELCISASCANDRITMHYDTAATNFGTASVIGGSAQGSSLTGAIGVASNAVYQLGVVKSAGVIKNYMNGSGHTATGSISYPSPDILYLGGSSRGEQLTGHLRKFTIRNRAVPDANMLTLTSD